MAKPRQQERAAKRAAPKKTGKNGAKKAAASAEAAAPPAEDAAQEEPAPDTLVDPIDAAPVESAVPDTVDDNKDSESTVEDTRAYLKGLLEALLFVGDRPLELKELARAARIDRKRTEELLREIAEDYSQRGMHLGEVAGGFAFRSNPLYSDQVRRFLAQRPVRLSRAQLETLSIVAYRQPITRPEVDDIRGVDCGPVLKGLLDRDLVRIIGKKDEPGRPMLYGTTQAFLELFSMSSLRDLPTLKEFTELSDESKQFFETKTGEEAPEGPIPDPTATPGEGAGAEGTAAAEGTQQDCPAESAQGGEPFQHALEPPNAEEEDEEDDDEDDEDEEDDDEDDEDDED